MNGPVRCANPSCPGHGTSMVKATGPGVDDLAMPAGAEPAHPYVDAEKVGHWVCNDCGKAGERFS